MMAAMVRVVRHERILSGGQPAVICGWQVNAWPQETFNQFVRHIRVRPRMSEKHGKNTYAGIMSHEFELTRCFQRWPVRPPLQRHPVPEWQSAPELIALVVHHCLSESVAGENVNAEYKSGNRTNHGSPNAR